MQSSGNALWLHVSIVASSQVGCDILHLGTHQAHSFPLVEPSLLNGHILGGHVRCEHNILFVLILTS